MPAIVVLGAQWGDEGKGKATDLLATNETIDFVVRTSGGHNAGHTIVVNGEKFATHLLPSGILTPGATCVIANGVVVSPEALFRELDALDRPRRRPGAAGRQRQRARDRVVPRHHRQGHRALPRQRQARHDRPRHRADVRRQDQPHRHPGRRPLRRGAPAAEGRGVAGRQEPAARQGLQPPRARRSTPSSRSCSRTSSGCGRWSPTRRCCSTARSTTARPCCSRARRRRCSTSTTAPTRSSRRRNPIAGGVCTGAGVGPTRIDRVIGVIKAYTTRVGSGPFPTELFDADGEKLWKVGGEVGVSTGRDRRCGWYDAVVARYSSRVNGLTDLFLTKLDVLSSWERVPVCVAYDVDGVRHDEMPMTQSEFARAKPIYEYLPRLVGGHLRLPRVRRPARERPGVRADARGDVRHPDLGRRRRPRSRADPRRPRLTGCGWCDCAPSPTVGACWIQRRPSTVSRR